jgi:Skp family chaperone for outer membrane proteins
MTKTTVLILFVLFTLSIPAYGADLKIAYLDFNRALNESEQGKKATAMLEEMIRDKKTAVIEKEEEIKKRRQPEEARQGCSENDQGFSGRGQEERSRFNTGNTEGDNPSY